jgi:hypothetical protein
VKTSEAISLIALLVSLSAAFFSYRLGRRTFNINAYHGATDRTLQLDMVFVNNPLLRPYFAEGVPVPPEGGGEDEMRQRVLAVAEYAVDILEDCWDKEECYKGDDRDAWRDWIYEVFETSPACTEHYAQHPAWYPTLTELFAERRGPPPGVQRAMAEPAAAGAPTAERAPEPARERAVGGQPPPAASKS